MKRSLITSATLYLGLLCPMVAQNLADSVSATSDLASPRIETAGTIRELPVTKAQASISESPAVYTSQDATTLQPRLEERQVVESVVDLSVLQESSTFRNLAAGRPDAVAEAEVQEIKRDLALISATYRESGKRESDCQRLALSLAQRVKLNRSEVLEILEKEIKSNPSCTCEIVKAAIRATEADTELVVAIVEMAIITSPESMRVASQCAIASAPESLTQVQALLTRYDANAGESAESAKSAKSAKGAKVAAIQAADTVAAMPNPLDFPGEGPIGPAGGGQPYFRPVTPVVVTFVTEVNP